MGILRVFLAFAVMQGHLSAGLFLGNGGGIAVSCFFIISGFYITLLLANPAVKVGDFYRSRALRIYPLYWLVALVSFFLAAWPNLVQMLHDERHYKLLAIFIVSNVVLFGQDIMRSLRFSFSDESVRLMLSARDLKPGYQPLCYLSVVGQAWSLASELMFYLLAPFLLRLPSVVLAVMFGLSLYLKKYLSEKPVVDGLWDTWLFPAAIMFFLGGVLLCRFYRGCMAKHEQARWMRWLCMGVVLAALGPFINSMVFTAQMSPYQYWSATLSAGAMTPCLFLLLRNNKADRWLGNLSYPIYLLHNMVLMIFSHTVSNHAVITWGAMAATPVLAVVAYYLVDRPLDRFRHRRYPTH